MNPMNRVRHRSRERGIALVMVVWVFMILGVLALDFSRYIRESAMAAANFAEETRGYYLALGGMNRAVFHVALARSQGGPAEGEDGRGQAREGGQAATDGQWRGSQLFDGQLEVRVTDQEGLFPINSYAERRDTTTLKRFVEGVALGPSGAVKGQNRRAAAEIDTIVSSIIDWVDRDRQTSPGGAEDKYYLGLTPPYRAKNQRLESPDELLMIRGVTPELFYGSEGMPGMRDLISVDSTKLSINPNTAPPELIAILLGKDEGGMAALEKIRADSPEIFGERLQGEATALGLNGAQLFSEEAGVVPGLLRVDGRADVSQPRNRSTVAWVVDVSDGWGELRTKRWIDRAPWEGGLPVGVPPEDERP